jgi:predicted adenylyl cyclase CyaB
MKEYSKKINVNKDILNKIKKLRAKKIFDGEMITLYYDFKDNSLTKRGKLLRLRKEGEKTELAFKEKVKSKGDINKTILKENLKVNVEDYDKMRQILKELGMEIIRKTKFNRKEFIIGKVKLELNDNKILEIESSDKGQLLKILKELRLNAKR